jgi:hypothetical protein
MSPSSYAASSSLSERFHLPGMMPDRQPKHRARIQSTTRIDADRDICAQSQTHGFLQHLAKLRRILNISLE